MANDNNKKNTIRYDGTDYILEDSRIPDPTGQSGKVLGVDSNGKYALQIVSGGGSGDGSGTTISVDSALSSESTNPVQNQAIKQALDDKVDKVEGKALSTKDYTAEEKTKLAGIAANAQVNVLEGIQTNGALINPVNKIVNITIPTKTSDLTNDSGFITSADVPSGGGSAENLEWVSISSGQGGLSGPLSFEAGENVGTISYLSAQYCPALKIVKFVLLALIKTRIEGTLEDPKTVKIIFKDNSKYKPEFSAIFDNFAACQGVVSGSIDSHPTACTIEVWESTTNNNFTYKLSSEINTTIYGDIGIGVNFYITGFYYTTDVPENNS